MAQHNEVQLGDVIKDSVTDFRDGMVVAITSWLNGCRRIGAQVRKLNDGKPHEIVWIDEPQAIVTKAAKRPEPARRTGGPRQDPMSSR